MRQPLPDEIARELEELGLELTLSARDRVLNALRDAQSSLGRTVRQFEIDERCKGIPRGTVSSSLHELKAKGLAATAGTGFWYARPQR